MARLKLPESVWGIFGETLKIYICDFLKFTGYMAFPVLGQIAGIIWVFASTFLLTDNFEYLVLKFPALNEFGPYMLSVILLALPGLLLFDGARPGGEPGGADQGLPVRRGPGARVGTAVPDHERANPGGAGGGKGAPPPDRRTG